MAGFLGMFNYDKPGRGVSENGPKKKGVFLFFEILFRKLKYIIFLNLLFVFTSIPIITIGPSFAAMTYVLKTYADGEHSWGAADYFSAFKKFFKQSFIIGIINMLFGFGFVYNLSYFAFTKGLLSIYMTWLFMAFIILLVIVHFYVYTLLVTQKQSILSLYTDAFILTLAKLPLNLLVTAAVGLYPAFIFWLYFTSSIPPSISIPISGMLLMFSMFSVVTFATTFYTQYIIRTYNK